jgi:carbon monoxide dehydrogenase subunit G
MAWLSVPRRRRVARRATRVDVDEAPAGVVSNVGRAEDPMSVMTRSIVINAPVGEVFEFARDPSRFVAAIPGFTTQLAVLTSDGVGSLTHATVHELGMHFAGTVEYIEVAPEESIAAKVSFPGEQPTWALTFEPLDSGTRLTMRAERHVNVPVVGRGIEAFDGPGARDDGRAVAHGSQGAA